MGVPHRVLGLLAVGVLGLTSRAAAQDINFQGYTEGCFYSGLETTCAPAGSSTLTYLSYVGSTFNVTSFHGSAGIGSNAALPNFNNLGSFQVLGQLAAYDGAHFLLNVVFNVPTTVPNASVFVAAVTGDVVADAYGNATISFNPSSEAFTFTTHDWTGDAVLNIAPSLSLTPGAPATALTGNIGLSNVTATPEPGTIALFATGLAGLIPVARSRRKKTA